MFDPDELLFDIQKVLLRVSRCVNKSMVVVFVPYEQTGEFEQVSVELWLVAEEQTKQGYHLIRARGRFQIYKHGGVFSQKDPHL
jgi:hypothetical protein